MQPLLPLLPVHAFLSVTMQPLLHASEDSSVEPDRPVFSV
jgi:hypothetical protein